MRYTSFLISNYRAITGPLKIVVDGPGLTPVIGVNESGKTTILQAIFAFDSFNDTSNDSIRHLQDTANLYQTPAQDATVTATITLSQSELKHCLHAREKTGDHAEDFARLRRKKDLPTTLLMRRNITTKNYDFPSYKFGTPQLENELATEILKRLPYILYFDDFRDKVAERIEIPQKSDDSSDEWVMLMEQLFSKTDPNFSLYSLPNLEERRRKTVLAKVERHLNNTLTKEWQSFRLDDRDALEISISYQQDASASGGNFLKLEVVERDDNGDKHYFFISDRSKGFYWFFNFVMKLEFNHKIGVVDGIECIYLLDEPGSYLHAFAQRKLCKKLKHIAGGNRVLYCTHSHYLLDPEIVPVSTIAVADKTRDGRVNLTRLLDFKNDKVATQSALQPLHDALMLRPYALDMMHAETTVLVEGIYDYFSLELFRGTRRLQILPCVGAESIKFYVSLMVGWQIKFRALWDNDEEGRKRHQRAVELFGEEIAVRHLRTLPVNDGVGKRIMQDLYSGLDLSMLRKELGLASDCAYEKTVQALFYSPARASLVAQISDKTKRSFEELFNHLSLPEETTPQSN